MNQEIQTALQKLQSQLELLEPAVYNVSEYSNVSRKAIAALEELEGHYRKHLEGVKQNLTTFLGVINTENNGHLSQIQSEYAAILRGITDETNKSIKSLFDIKQSILDFIPKLEKSNEQHLNRVSNEYAETLKDIKTDVNAVITAFKYNLIKSTALVTAVERLTDKIDKVDFPSRLSKIDNGVTNTYTGIQNLQGRIDLLEMNIKEQIQNKTNDIMMFLEVQKKRQIRGLMLNYIIIVLLIILIGLICWGIKMK
jgi:gas vesicle protein